jgi:hypothetical protein
VLDSQNRIGGHESYKAHENQWNALPCGDKEWDFPVPKNELNARSTVEKSVEIGLLSMVERKGFKCKKKAHLAYTFISVVLSMLCGCFL